MTTAFLNKMPAVGPSSEAADKSVWEFSRENYALIGREGQ